MIYIKVHKFDKKNRRLHMHGKERVLGTVKKWVPPDGDDEAP